MLGQVLSTVFPKLVAINAKSFLGWSPLVLHHQYIFLKGLLLLQLPSFFFCFFLPLLPSYLTKNKVNATLEKPQIDLVHRSLLLHWSSTPWIQPAGTSVVQTNSSRDCRIKFRFPVPLRWTTTERKEGRRRRRRRHYTLPNCVFPPHSLTPNGSSFLSVIVAAFLTTGWIISNRWQQHRGLHLVLVSQRRRSGDRTGQGLRTQAMLPLPLAASAAAPGGARYQLQLPTTYLSTSFCSTCSFLNTCASSWNGF